MNSRTIEYVQVTHREYWVYDNGTIKEVPPHTLTGKLELMEGQFDIRCVDSECTGSTKNIADEIRQIVGPKGPYTCPYCRGIRFFIGPKKG
jgi:hypothetical protein